MVSINVENINVEIRLYPKKGSARVQQVTSPFKSNEYMPEVQTPKFVIIKKIKTPPKAPTIL